jgi:hypothetical protein
LSEACLLYVAISSTFLALLAAGNEKFNYNYDFYYTIMKILSHLLPNNFPMNKTFKTPEKLFKKKTQTKNDNPHRFSLL